MISQAELERAIARYKARQAGGAVDAASYPADVEVGYEGTATPVPPPGWGADRLPREAYRSDSELAALRRGGNEEPTVVAEVGAEYAMLDSGVVELSDSEDER